jgi:hypothetical protein
LWAKHNPIDDQSNHHIPIAHLHATVAGFGGSSKKITDFLIFGEPANDFDSILASNDWGAD